MRHLQAPRRHIRASRFRVVHAAPTARSLRNSALLTPVCVRPDAPMTTPARASWCGGRWSGNHPQAAPIHRGESEAPRFLRFPDAAPPVGQSPCSSRAEPVHLPPLARSEEHTSDLQSLMRISYAVFCLHNTTETEKPHVCNYTTSDTQ